MAELGMAFLNPGIAVQEQRIKAAELGPRLAQMEAAARLNNSSAARQEEQAVEGRARAAALSKLAGKIDYENDPQAFFRGAAEIEAGLGNTKEAGAFLAQGELVGSRAARAAQQQALTQKAETDAQVRKMEFWLHRAGGVKKQSDYEVAADVYRQTFKEEPPLAYSPTLAKDVAGLALKQGERLAAERGDQRLLLMATGEATRQAFSETRARQAEDRIRLSREAGERRAKAGGAKTTGEKSPATLRRLENATLREFKDDPALDGLKGTEKLSALESISEGAMRRVKANPTLTGEQAVRLEIEAAKKRGDLTTEKGFFGDKPRFSGKGNLASDPAPWPEETDIKKLENALVPGKHYVRKGVTYLWDGHLAIPVGGK